MDATWAYGVRCVPEVPLFAVAVLLAGREVGGGVELQARIGVWLVRALAYFYPSLSHPVLIPCPNPCCEFCRHV